MDSALRGLPVVDDGTSAALRAQVAQHLRAFGAATQGFENDAVICATALEKGIPLITGDRAFGNAVAKLGGEVQDLARGDARVVLSPESGQVVSMNPLSGGGANR